MQSGIPPDLTRKNARLDFKPAGHDIADDADGEDPRRHNAAGWGLGVHHYLHKRLL